MGGKFYEHKEILDLMPAHRYYYEVFFGSGVLLINKPKSEEEFANDINSRLVSFWECLGDKKLTEILKAKCERTLDSKFIYELEMEKWKIFGLPVMESEEELIREEFISNLVDRAFNFLYLIKYGFNSYPNTYYTPLTHAMGTVKNMSQTFRLTAQRLLEYHNRIKDVRFTNYDFLDCLKKAKPHYGKFFVLDPPYYNTHSYDKDYGIDSPFKDTDYINMRDALEEHTEGGSYWMITCNQTNPFFDDMKNTRYVLINRRACINKNKERADVKTKVIMNYDIRKVDSVYTMEMERQGKQGDGLLI